MDRLGPPRDAHLVRVRVRVRGKGRGRGRGIFRVEWIDLARPVTRTWLGVRVGPDPSLAQTLTLTLTLTWSGSTWSDPSRAPGYDRSRQGVAASGPPRVRSRVKVRVRVRVKVRVRVGVGCNQHRVLQPRLELRDRRG